MFESKQKKKSQGLKSRFANFIKTIYIYIGEDQLYILLYIMTKKGIST